MDAMILASSSPRRQEILKKLGIPFVVRPANIDETAPKDIKIRDVPEFLAARKAAAVCRSYPAEEEPLWILGADTIIVYRNRLYGKPASREEAVEFIRTLQGHTHEVITGMALYSGAVHDMTSRTSISKVTLAPMSDAEIEWYIGTGEWHGAAGAYRIQGLASCFIERIQGTESSIMGLPIFELYDMLREHGYSFI